MRSHGIGCSIGVSGVDGGDDLLVLLDKVVHRGRVAKLQIANPIHMRLDV